MTEVQNRELKVRIFCFMKNQKGSKKSILTATYASLEDVMFTKEGKMKYNVGTAHLYDIVQETYKLLFEV